MVATQHHTVVRQVEKVRVPHGDIFVRVLENDDNKA